MTTESKAMRKWRRYHAQQLQLAFDGNDGAIVKRIMEIVRNFTPQKMPTLLRLMRSVDWRPVNANTKFTILHELNGAIAALRESENRVPFNDSLPGEEPTLFQIIREML